MLSSCSVVLSRVGNWLFRSCLYKILVLQYCPCNSITVKKISSKPQKSNQTYYTVLEGILEGKMFHLLKFLVKNNVITKYFSFYFNLPHCLVKIYIPVFKLFSLLFSSVAEIFCFWCGNLWCPRCIQFFVKYFPGVDKAWYISRKETLWAKHFHTYLVFISFLVWKFFITFGTVFRGHWWLDAEGKSWFYCILQCHKTIFSHVTVHRMF